MDEATGLYPLTEDLMTVFQKTGEYQGWYGEGGWIGGEDSDAWMFACYYSEDIKGEADIPSEDNSNDNTDNGAADNNSGNTNQGNTSAPVTGDNVIVIVAIAVVAIVAVAVILFIRKRKAN